MGDRKKMPKKYDIYEFWSDDLVDLYGKFWIDEKGVSKSKFKEKDSCFACGSNATTQRCHILPKDKGGTDDIDNIHLLCSFCHIESESFSGNLYEEWFLFKNSSNSLMNKMFMNRVDLYKKLIEENKGYLLPDWVKKTITP